jgi:hypothetical protein
MRTGSSTLLILLSAAVLTAGCATVERQSAPHEVKVFFGAANAANFQGIQRGSGKQLDLSGYTHLMEVQYPPTQTVEVLNRPPSRPYQAFAVLETSLPSSTPTYDPKMLDSIKDKARAIGADAIIFCGPQDRMGLPGLENSSNLAAVAVKYRVEGQTRRP